jgi:hypothetical protein
MKIIENQEHYYIVVQNVLNRKIGINRLSIIARHIDEDSAPIWIYMDYFKNLYKGVKNGISKMSEIKKEYYSCRISELKKIVKKVGNNKSISNIFFKSNKAISLPI